MTPVLFARNLRDSVYLSKYTQKGEGVQNIKCVFWSYKYFAFILHKQKMSVYPNESVFMFRIKLKGGMIKERGLLSNRVKI